LQGILTSTKVHHIILFACNGPQPATNDLTNCLVAETACSEYVLGACLVSTDRRSVQAL
jgi:hypothetical protein